MLRRTDLPSGNRVGELKRIYNVENVRLTDDPRAVGRGRHMLEVTVATHRPIAVLLVRSFDRSAPPEVAPSDYADFFINHKESLNR